jgi:rubrerythrin
MIKVYENFDFSRVGQMQSLLEAHGIRTFLRNQYGSSVMGEVPFVEVVPQLFVLENKDEARALELIRLEAGEAEAGEAWICRHCGAEVDGEFSRCWKCGEAP